MIRKPDYGTKKLDKALRTKRKEKIMRLTAEEKRKIWVSLIIITVAIILYHIFNNLSGFLTKAAEFYRGALQPVVTAFFIAYVMNLPMRFIERILAKKIKKKSTK